MLIQKMRFAILVLLTLTATVCSRTPRITGATPGTYTASVEVDDGRGCVPFSSKTVTVAPGTDGLPPCPTITIACATDQVPAGSPATVNVDVRGGGNFSVTYFST